MSATPVLDLDRPVVAPKVQPGSAVSVLAWPVFAAFALRVGSMLAFQTYNLDELAANHFTGPNYPFGYETGSIAASIAIGRGFSSPFGVVTPTGPTAWIGPVYPYLCAALFKVFGVFTTSSAIAILTVNVFFSALTCIPLFFLAERLFGRRLALWTTWAWAVCPLFFRWPITWIWEISLSALLATLLVWLAVRWRDCESGRREAVLYGLLVGLSILVNPVLMIVAGVCILWVGAHLYRRGSAVMKHIALCGVICLGVLSPWLVRNWMVFGKPVFVRGNFWVEFAIGNYHLSNAMGWGGKHPTANLAEFTAYQQMGELAYVASKKQVAIAFLKDYPGEFVQLCLQRLAVFWDGEAFAYQPKQNFFEAWFFAPISLLAALGLWLMLRRRLAVGSLLAAVLLFYPAVYYITFSQPRYRHAIEPVMLLAVVYLMQEGWRAASVRLARR